MKTALRPLFLLIFLLILGIAIVHAQSSDLEKRRHVLDELLKVLNPSRPPAVGRISAYDRTWEDWVRRTGELPPDFDAMPSMPDLPDPLVIHENGRATPVTTPALWTRQKQLLRADVEHWIFGRMPPAPGNLRTTVTATHRRRRRHGS